MKARVAQALGFVALIFVLVCINVLYSGYLLPSFTTLESLPETTRNEPVRGSQMQRKAVVLQEPVKEASSEEVVAFLDPVEKASEQIKPDASVVKATPTTTDKRLVIWTYPMPPAGDLLMLGENEVLYCAYRLACPQQWTTTAQRLNLRQLTRDTPYQQAVLQQMLLKIAQGKSYPDHVQSLTLLAMVQKNKDICVRSWGDFETVICVEDLPKYADYRPELYAKESLPTAPLIPSSKPNLDTLHFNTFRYPNGWRGNSGDEIQDLTGVQFQPFISDFFNRDHGWKKATGQIVANAWFGNPLNFPKNMEKTVDPTFVSVHFSGGGIWSMDEKNRPNVLSYFKDYYTKEVGPVGARDSGTLAFLQKHNITSYLSRCMTLMLQYGCQCTDCPAECPQKDSIVVNDVKDADLPETIREKLKGAKRVTAKMMFQRDSKSFPKTFEYAFDLLETYSKQAKLVITSRLHSALPSFAMGTPVIFVNPKKLPGGGGGRLSGILDLLHVYEPGDKWTFDLENPPPNPGVHIADRNRASLWNYLKRRSSYYEDTARLHGMIPLQRLGKDQSFPNLFGDFHFVVGPDATMSWQFVRAIEYVFFHHPNAHVHVHTNAFPVKGSQLDIFVDTGYQLTVEPYALPQLIQQEAVPQALRDSFLKDLPTLQLSANWDQHEMDLVKLLVLYKSGGVYLNNDVFVLKPLIPETLQNSFAATSTTIFMLMVNPQLDALEIAIQWTLKSFKSQTQSSERQLLVESKLSKLLTALKPEDFDLFHEDRVRCFRESMLDLTNLTAHAIRIDSSLWSEHNLTLRGTTCDQLLYQYCIFCDELHTFPELGET